MIVPNEGSVWGSKQNKYCEKHIFGIGATEDVRSYDVADIGDDDSAEFFVLKTPH